MLFSISYVLLGLVAVMHAIPVDTAPSHPPRAVSLLDPRRFHELPQLPPEHPKHKIVVTFLHGEPTRRVCLDPLIKKELTLIFKEYRRQLNTDRRFVLLFQNNFRHGGTIHQNLHDVSFWGEGVGRDCELEDSPCSVWYDESISPRVPKPTTPLATVATADDHVLFEVTYAMRNRVLSESGHPVPVPNGRSCNVM
ncbi:hypothetical protein F5890DRAFT_1200662 [Lentinula detonsa]|uniref:Secreted protein n=1 Tax=Lentinula detonsa TaxID=2804962 RepID=A0AA38UMJ8_9AGAR|nr:hypothetical protein F5890DRAFT_1200662 [Lentinula detonsa]